LKFLEEKQIPHLPPCETSHKKIEDPPNDKQKIEDSEISKYRTKNFQSSDEERHIPHFLACETSHKKI
jgi:hypothetical protein